MKFFRLLQSIGSRGSIDDKQSEMRCGFIVFGDDAANFRQLFHQIVPRVQSACGIANQEVCLLRNGFLVRGEAD